MNRMKNAGLLLLGGLLLVTSCDKDEETMINTLLTDIKEKYDDVSRNMEPSS